MSLSSVTIEQREKEAEALKTFLFFSFIASLGLHIGVLTLAINKFFSRIPEITEKPIEVTILETIPQKVAQLPVDIKSLPKINSGGSGNKGGGISTPTETAISIIKSSVAPVAKQSQPKITNNLIRKQSQTLTTPESAKTATPIVTNPIKNTTPEPAKTATPIVTNPIQNTTPEPAKTATPIETNPIQNLDENSTSLASTQPQRDPKTANTTPLKSENQPSASSNNIPSNSTELPENKNILGNLGDRSWRNILGKGSGNGVGNNSGNGIGNNSGNGIGNNSGNGIGNNSGNGVGNNSGNGVGNNSGNGVGNKAKPENTPITTAPKPNIENSSKLNRADCLQCQIKYPDRARRRGAEGNPEVAINTDAKGNVTQVKLIRSSGDSELDEAAQQAAQEWKLTPTETGREGVRASVNFAIKGSQRHRQLQERQIEKEREAAQKKPEKEASTSSPIESPQRNQRKKPPIITDVPPENTTRHRQESAPSEGKPKQTEESPPRRRSRQPVKSDTDNQADEVRAERVQKSGRRLEEILRRRQKSSDSPPRDERVQKSGRRLEEILRRRQKSSDSPPPEAPTPPEPATTSPTDSNRDSENSN